ncbi:MAG: hypothetical protein KAV87_38680 [Desulfobacteraceae bacterium]|nr:hypothetical protein [Desulfobacteraceae bacterium]
MNSPCSRLSSLRGFIYAYSYITGTKKTESSIKAAQFEVMRWIIFGLKPRQDKAGRSRLRQPGGAVER